MEGFFDCALQRGELCGNSCVDGIIRGLRIEIRPRLRDCKPFSSWRAVDAPEAASRPLALYVRCITLFWSRGVPNPRGKRREDRVVTVTEAAKVVSSTLSDLVNPAARRRLLPLAGLILAIVLNVAWVGLLAYWVFKLI
jgi:hypothetical protein